MAKRGFRRMTLYVPEPQVPVVEALKLALREMGDEDRFLLQEGLHGFFCDMVQAYEDDLHAHPELAYETSIREEIAFLKKAADATAPIWSEARQRTERSEGGTRSGHRCQD